jgi:hypothetical protein
LPYLLIISAIVLVGTGVSADTVAGGAGIPALSVAAGDGTGQASGDAAVKASGGIGSAEPPAASGSLAAQGSPSAPESGLQTPASAAAADTETQGRSTVQGALAPPRLALNQPKGRLYFPALYNPGLAFLSTEAASVGVEEKAGARRIADEPETSQLPVLANNQVLAFYGHPFSKKMGILGEYSKEDLARLVKGYAKLYDDANGDDMGVVPAYYLIYGTCWPGGEIGYLKDSVVVDYIDYAASQGMLVFVDHQIGKYPVDQAVKRLLPFLKYPNVHLALDPEWRTTLPMQEIGSITADEVNMAQDMIRDYMNAEGIPGTRMLVVHQFRTSMIQGRDRVKADKDRVLLVHTADGFGPPQLKKNTYALNALASNMPLKGFKLFFKTTVPGAGYDLPLLTPPEVLSLNPKPMLIIYQ